MDVQVIVVGSGPSGLAAAIELGSRGIKTLIIEQGERAGYAPRAKTTHIRTREHLRRWGIADKLADAAPFGVDYPSNAVFVSSLAGHEIARFANAMYCDPAQDDRYSEHAQWIAQYTLEAVLREHALSLAAVSIEYGCQFVSHDQSDDHVRVHVQRSGRASEDILTCSYLVGADGARSAVRDAIGATMEGTYGLSTNYNVIFRAPGLATAHGHGPAIMYWQLGGETPSLIGPMDRDDIWFFMPTGLPQGTKLGIDEIRARIVRSTWIEADYEILSSDVWVASRLLADRYAAGRAFLIGDACHLHPPFGGYGMNMGVADGVDIGWKIAAMLDGWGGPALLDSYERERRPNHIRVLDEAEANHSSTPDKLMRPHLGSDGPIGVRARAELGAFIRDVKDAEFHAMGVTLGFCYQDSPVIIGDDDTVAWQFSREYRPSGAPGSLAPHRWLAPGKSLYDLFGSGFTLLTFEPSHAYQTVSQSDDVVDGVPLRSIRMNDSELHGLYGARFVLIRPDQIVAWRGDTAPDASVLRSVTGRASVEPQAVSL